MKKKEYKCSSQILFLSLDLTLDFESELRGK